jgi:hypothetical protein
VLALERATTGAPAPGSPTLASTTTTPDESSGEKAAPPPAADTPRTPSRWPGLKDTFSLGLAWDHGQLDRASREQMRWRCQLGLCRTSSWSSPLSPSS